MTPNPRSASFIVLPSTTGVLTRRVIAYALDFLFIVLFGGLMWWLAAFLTVFSFGLLHGAFLFVALVPMLYCTITIAGPHAATWGMRMMSIGYRREDGGRPTPAQAFAVSLMFYFSVYLSGGLILLVAVITRQHRTLHDLLAGLVMIRTDQGAWII